MVEESEAGIVVEHHVAGIRRLGEAGPPRAAAMCPHRGDDRGEGVCGLCECLSGGIGADQQVDERA